MLIDYQKIVQSEKFFTNKGYIRIETPWFVPPSIDNITKPKEKRHFQLKHNDKCLVASGEQSFLYLIMQGYLPNGKYQTITPCFRDDQNDLTHRNHFIKNELIVVNPTNPRLVCDEMIRDAFDFYSDILKLNEITGDRHLEIVYESNGADIVMTSPLWDSPIELGSYGVREAGSITWVYGTACAEPRLSIAIETLKSTIR